MTPMALDSWHGAMRMWGLPACRKASRRSCVALLCACVTGNEISGVYMSNSVNQCTAEGLWHLTVTLLIRACCFIAGGHNKQKKNNCVAAASKQQPDNTTILALQHSALTLHHASCNGPMPLLHTARITAAMLRQQKDAVGASILCS